MYAAGRDGAIVVLPGRWPRKTWWRNLTSGAVVGVRVLGRDVAGRATVLRGTSEPTATAAALAGWLRRFPRSGGRLGADKLRHGAPSPAQLAALASASLVVRIVPDEPLPADPPRLGRWVAACVGGEVIGLGVAAGAVATLRTLGDSLSARLMQLLIAVAGGLEGLALGGLQASALRTRLPALSWRRYVGATATVAVAAWAVGMLPSTLSPGGEAAQAGAGPPLGLLLAAMFAGGLAAGGVIGSAQARALRCDAVGLHGWIGANAVAWAIALVWIGLLASVPTAAWPWWLTAIDGAVAGVLSGLTVGVVTGSRLPQLMPAPGRSALPPRSGGADDWRDEEVAP